MSLIPSGELKATPRALRTLLNCINESNSLRGVERLNLKAEMARRRLVSMSLIPSGELKDTLASCRVYSRDHVSMSLIPSGELKVVLQAAQLLKKGVVSMSLIPSGELKGVDKSLTLGCSNDQVSMSLIPSGELKVPNTVVAPGTSVRINESNSLRGVERSNEESRNCIKARGINESNSLRGVERSSQGVFHLRGYMPTYQ